MTCRSILVENIRKTSTRTLRIQQGQIERHDEIHLVLEQLRTGHDIVDVEHRQHHRGQRLAGNAERQQRDHRRAGNRIVGGFRRDQPFRAPLAEGLRRFRRLLRAEVNKDRTVPVNSPTPGIMPMMTPKADDEAGDPPGSLKHLAKPLEQTPVPGDQFRPPFGDCLVLADQQHKSLADGKQARARQRSD